MAAPLVVAVPAILSALWSGLVICFKWLIDHAHVAKVAITCILIITSFWAGIKIYTQLVHLLDLHISNLGTNLPHGVNGALDILSKANYCLPVSEMLSLLAVYVTCWGSCMLIRFMLSMYRTVPFKNT